MVANSGKFTFRFNQYLRQKSPEKALNIGFFGFFVYCYLLTISFKGCTCSCRRNIFKIIQIIFPCKFIFILLEKDIYSIFIRKFFS